MVNHRKSRSSEKFNSSAHTSASTKAKSKHNSNHVRIIGGDWRGRKLSFPGLDGLRPTGDRMRETLFNWLQADIQGAQVVDLFAGSGSLGLESLSRGASRATFVELDKQAARSIQQNLQLLDAKNALVQNQSAFDYIESAKAESCDLLFLDPPFADAHHNEILESVYRQKIMRQGAAVYIEAPLSASIAIPPAWTVYREKASGQVKYLLCHCQGTSKSK